MKQETAIQKTHEFLKDKFSGKGSSNDYWHTYRTWKMAQYIAAREPDADLFTVELAALLNDVADWKFNDGDLKAGPRAARDWLEELGVDEAIITHVEAIILNAPFKGAGVMSRLDTLEGKIVHDADKLDAIGAIGIGRAFAYGGMKGRPLHDPTRKPELHESFEAYRQNDTAENSTINHFYEKLLLLKSRMLTKTGKAIAEHRHLVMEQFLQEFFAEWEGKR